MSWWYEVKKAVQTRLTGDTGTGGLFNTGTPLVTGLSEQIAVDAAASMYPYLVKRYVGVNAQDCFRTNHTVINFDVQAFVETEGLYGTDTAENRLDKIIKRILGDWEEQVAGTGPTYGLDRWTPGALGSTGYTADSVYRTGGPMPNPQDDVLGEVISFAVHVSKAGA